MRLASELLGPLRPWDFAIEFWDGAVLEADGEERVRVVVRRPQALRALLDLDTDLAVAEAYVYGDVDIQGDIEALFQIGRAGLRLIDLPVVARTRALVQLARSVPRQARRGAVLARMRGKRSSVRRDERAVRFHYDRSNEFFGLFLDPRMVYSCAYFRHQADSLAVAQEQKLDLVCRKLRLQPGQRLIDIGSGWGALIMHAARHYGVEAVGLTLSPAQAQLARERIAAEGLEARCRVEVCDYREFAETGFDAVASVGMVEHVAPAMLAEYFASAMRMLRPGGVMLNHGITTTDPGGARSQFIRRYVFPDADLSPLHDVLAAASQAGLEVRDVEGLREHYALTLRRWLDALEAHHDAAVRAAGEDTYRVWRLYMAGSANAFTANRLGIFQTLLVRPDRDRSGLPLTRADWYPASAV